MTVQRLIQIVAWKIVLLIFFISSPSFALKVSPKICSSLFELKEYLKSAMCYEKLVEDMSKKKSLSRFQKRVKGLHLRNAATAYQKAGKQEKNDKERLYLLEKSSLLLKIYLKERLCTKNYQCNDVRGILQRNLEKIAYSTLTLVYNNKKPIKTTIIGYKYTKSLMLPPNWTGKIRPGDYLLKIYYKNHFLQKITISLQSGKAKIVSLSIPQKHSPSKREVVILTHPPKRKILIPAIVVGAGLVVASTGGGLILLGINTANQIKGLNHAREIGEQRTKAKTQYFTGWIVLGVGVGTMLTSSILIFLSNPPPKKQQITPPKLHPNKHSALTIQLIQVDY